MTDEARRLEDKLNEMDKPFDGQEYGADVYADDPEPNVHIRHLRVAPEYRRMGLATQMITQTLELMEESGIAFAELSINVTEEGGTVEFLENYEYESENGDILGFEDITVHPEGDEKIAGAIMRL